MQKSKVVEYKKGDIVYRQGEPPDAFYCVITGRVRIYTQAAALGQEKTPQAAARKVVLEYLNCGKYFGVVSLLTGDTHSLSAEAVNDSRILRITKDDFQAILKKIPRLSLDLSMTLSRRLRKRDIGEKKIFESNIISIFSASIVSGSSAYATNFALSLRKETGRKVILINISQNIPDTQKSVTLSNALLAHNSLEHAIYKDAAVGADLINVKYTKVDDNCFHSLNALLTYLTGSYHYVIIDLPIFSQNGSKNGVYLNQIIFQVLNQSDMIHIITESDMDSLKNTKDLISSLFEKVNYPEEKIKIIIDAIDENRILSNEEVTRFLNYKIYATLPPLAEKGEIEERPQTIVLDKPQADYSKAVRRVAREIGDKRVGLALGGGAAYGLAHVGVLKVLERENIPIDIIAGCSMGAFIGALWAIGLTSGQIEDIVLEYNDDFKKTITLLGDVCFPKMSIAKGERIRSFLKKHIGDKTFHDIKVPLKVVACNLTKREKIVFDSGSLADAVMASIAIPGVFAPSRINKDLIIDGGILEPVPVGTLIKMGIKRVIAVNVLPSPENIIQNYDLTRRRIEEEKRQLSSKKFIERITYKIVDKLRKEFTPNIMDIIVNSIQALEYVIAESDCQKADVVISPVGVGAEWFEFFKVKLLIEKGEEETMKALDAIKNVVTERQ